MRGRFNYSDATGTYNRYGFHLGSNFFDYPHLSVWPDGYYMSMNVFNSSGTSFLGPQPFAFDRAKMLRVARDFRHPGGSLGWLDRCYFCQPILTVSLCRPTGAPATFVGFPGLVSNPNYTTFHFHVDFTTPANSTFTTFATPAAAGYHLALSDHASLRASVGSHFVQLPRWDWRSFDVPARLSQLRRPRSGSRQLHCQRSVGLLGFAGLSCVTLLSDRFLFSRRAPTGPILRGAGWVARPWTARGTLPLGSALPALARILRFVTPDGWQPIRLMR